MRSPPNAEFATSDTYAHCEIGSEAHATSTLSPSRYRDVHRVLAAIPLLLCHVGVGDTQS
jgi:hypothetical protein